VHATCKGTEYGRHGPITLHGPSKEVTKDKNMDSINTSKRYRKEALSCFCPHRKTEILFSQTCKERSLQIMACMASSFGC
jgi:hypothetical protein